MQDSFMRFYKVFHTKYSIQIIISKFYLEPQISVNHQTLKEIAFFFINGHVLIFNKVVQIDETEIIPLVT